MVLAAALSLTALPSLPGVTRIKESADELCKLSHKDFQSVWRFDLQPLLQKEFSLPEQRQVVQQTIDDFQKARDVFQSRLRLPICIATGNVDVPPKYVIADSVGESGAKQFPDGIMYLTPKVIEQFEKMPKAPLETKKDLDSLVQTLSGMSDLMSWDSITSGCFSRAVVSADVLALCGVPRECMSWQFNIVPQAYRQDGFMAKWTFHVALRVNLKNGTSYIVDPGFSPFRAMEFADWRKLQYKPGLKTPPEIIDKGLYDPKKEGSTLSYDPKKGLSFSLPCTMHMAKHVLGKIEIGDFTNKNKEICLTKLASYRSRTEKSWMMLRV